MHGCILSSYVYIVYTFINVSLHMCIYVSLQFICIMCACIGIVESKENLLE